MIKPNWIEIVRAVAAGIPTSPREHANDSDQRQRLQRQRERESAAGSGHSGEGDAGPPKRETDDHGGYEDHLGVVMIESAGRKTVLNRLRRDDSRQRGGARPEFARGPGRRLRGTPPRAGSATQR